MLMKATSYLIIRTLDEWFLSLTTLHYNVVASKYYSSSCIVVSLETLVKFNIDNVLTGLGAVAINKLTEQWVANNCLGHIPLQKLCH